MFIVTQTNQDQDTLENFVQGPVRIFMQPTVDTALQNLTQLLTTTASDLALEAIDAVKVPDSEQWGANAVGHLLCKHLEDGYYVHLVIYKLS